MKFSRFVGQVDETVRRFVSKMTQVKTPNGVEYPPREKYVIASKKDVVELRGKNMFSSLRTSYSEPALLVHGQGQYMFDEQGNEYLDCYNNIPHIGHSHPKLVAAAQEQLKFVCTNTRYLHDKVAVLASRLAATLPEKLSVVMFCNSGSEANDLAMRLSRIVSRKRGTVCLEGAYHGTTIECTKISPHPYYAGGRDVLDLSAIEVAAVPDTYRGQFKKGEENVAGKYAQSVKDAILRLEAKGVGCAAFIAETIQGCGGQIVFPDGYLKAVYDIVHEHGGLYIADEVQVGFGRSGSSYWAFESHGFVPDILTIGKSFGNGLPLSALVTTKEIADQFNGHEYFSSVAGNPVSAAAGLAVMDVVEEEHLQERAKVVSERILNGFEALKKKHALIGDVRGCGMFIGVEFVRDHTTLEPADKETSLIKEKLYRRRLLTGTLGVQNNVLRIKPPMCFSLENADYLVGQLDEVLTEISAELHPAKRTRHE